MAVLSLCSYGHGRSQAPLCYLPHQVQVEGGTSMDLDMKTESEFALAKKNNAIGVAPLTLLLYPFVSVNSQYKMVLGTYTVKFVKNRHKVASSCL